MSNAEKKWKTTFYFDNPQQTYVSIDTKAPVTDIGSKRTYVITTENKIVWINLDKVMQIVVDENKEAFK